MRVVLLARNAQNECTAGGTQGREGRDMRAELRGLEACISVCALVTSLSPLLIPWRNLTMAESPKVERETPPMSAEQLRMSLLDQQMKEAEKRQKAKSEEERQHADFAADFLKNRVSDNEIAMVRRLVMNAVKDGKFEALVYSFPSELCTDSGRAINSAEPEWPETLQGKAKEFYERYQEFAKPQGYKLKAMIISFPGGMPGDVGFFLDWAPDKA